MRDTGDRGVHVRSAQLLERHFFMGHCLHDVRPGHEHPTDAADHEYEVGDGRRVHGTSRAGPEDAADLGDHAGCQSVPQEDVGVAAERGHAFLDARPTRVVEAHDREPVLQSEIQQLNDLLGVRLGERAAKDREVLAERVDGSAFDMAVAGDDAVSGVALLLEAEIGAAVLDEAVQLDERVLVE
jgi:hypothetical protein